MITYFGSNCTHIIKAKGNAESAKGEGAGNPVECLQDNSFLASRIEVFIRTASFTFPPWRRQPSGLRVAGHSWSDYLWRRRFGNELFSR